MFQRNILSELSKWVKRADRKPLVLRGARQVGKTTAVNIFAKNFSQYIYLNLEIPGDRKPFEEFTSIDTLIQTLFIQKNIAYSKKENTLLFIDEIQELPEALNILRYFYEQEPGIPVIAAGSLLETIFNAKISFPVGRVEYLVVRPVSFPEFLFATNEMIALKQLENFPMNDFAYDKLLSLFHMYALIGGMPEIVKNYAANKDITDLGRIYNLLITSYMDDVEKYAFGNTQVQQIRHAIKSSYTEAGKRIKFEGFGGSNYRSKEMGEALRTLEKALLIHLVYPITGATLPVLTDKKKSPRLQVLDTGLMNYFAGIQKDIIGTQDLNSIHNGLVIEHLAGQELLSVQYDTLSELRFWVREKKQSQAEVDYIINYNAKLIPVEIKSGATGKLKSLHLYMDIAPHNMAVRFCATKINITKVTTPTGKEYFLLTLPYFLVSKIYDYMPWFEGEIKKM
jgi:uncharacterized protein